MATELDLTVDIGRSIMESIIIFGTGNRGKEAYKYLSKDYDVVAFADNNASLHGQRLFDTIIISPQDIELCNYDKLVISTVYYKEIYRQLKNMGFGNIYLYEQRNWNSNSGEYDIFLIQLFTSDDFEFEYKHMDRINIERSRTDNNRILMITYTFPPAGGAAVQRPTKFIKYLRCFGYEPVVVTTGRDNSVIASFDESLEKDIPPGMEIIRISDEYIMKSLNSKEKMQEIVDLLITVTEDKEYVRSLFDYSIENNIHMLPDVRLLWAYKCIRYIEDNIDLSKIASVWTTVPYYSCNFVGHYFKKKYGLPWIADYRDLWTSSNKYAALYTRFSNYDVMLQRPLEKRLLMETDCIVVAGGKWEKTFRESLNLTENKIVEITNGYDEDDFTFINEKKNKNDVFTLCYNGRMHHQCRNPHQIIRIITDLIDEQKISCDKICWVINGQVSDQFLEEIKKVDKYGIIHMNGQVDHDTCVQFGIDSDLMIFYGEPGENGWINYPGKFYEYLRIGRPILCISGHGSFQEDILEKCNLGKNFDSNEDDQIKEYIFDQYYDWMKIEFIIRLLKNSSERI